MLNGMLNQRKAKSGETPPATAPARVLSPAELAEQLMDLTCDLPGYQLLGELRKAKEALAVVQAKVDRAGEKKLRILRARSIEEAQAIADESAIDANLKALCQKRPGWKPLQEKGATDEQLEKFLGTKAPGWPEYRPYNNHAMPSAEVGYAGRAQAWVDPDKGPEGNAHLSGQKLIDAVRRVMGIKKPAAPGPAVPKKKPSPPKKPTPAKKPAAKPKAPPAAPKKPASPPDENGDDDPGDSEEFDGDEGAEASASRRAKFEAQARGGTLAALNEQLSAMRARKKPSEDGLDPLRTEVIEAELAKRQPPQAQTPQKKKAGGLSDVETIRITAPMGASIDVSVGKVASGEHRWRAGCRVVLHHLNNRALYEPLEAKGGACSSRALAVRAMLEARVRPFLEKLAKDGRESAKSRDFNDGEHKFLQDAISAVILFLHTNVEADTGGVLPPDASSPASGAKPKHPSIVAHNAVLSRGGTFEQAAVAGALADRDGVDEMLAHGPDSKCRVCGCTEEDCRECIEATGGPCRWVEDPIRQGDLCSRCKPEEYGRRVSGRLAGGGAKVEGLRIIGEAERNGELCFQVNTDGDGELWVRVEGSIVAADTDATPDAWDDPNVDGRGVFVSGVEEIVAWGQAMNDKAKIVIHVARGADGLYRTGHLLEFKGAQTWNADGYEPVRISAQAVESEAYAIKTRAEILVNLIKAAPGPAGGGAWSSVQRTTYNAAIKALQSFIAHNPACKEPKLAKAGAA